MQGREAALFPVFLKLHRTLEHRGVARCMFQGALLWQAYHGGAFRGGVFFIQWHTSSEVKMSGNGTREQQRAARRLTTLGP